MSEPIRFEDLPDTAYGALLLPRRPVTLHLAPRTVGFGDEERPTFDAHTNDHFAARPPREALFEERALNDFVGAGHNAYARWIRASTMIAWLGGQVRYRYPDDDTVVAMITFREPAVGDHVLLEEGACPVAGVEGGSVEVCLEEVCAEAEPGHPHARIPREALVWDQANVLWAVKEGTTRRETAAG